MIDTAEGPAPDSTVEQTTAGANGGQVGKIFMASLVFVFIAAFVTPNFKKSRSSPVRACFANQKTLAGAIEMYNLDRNGPLLRCDLASARMLVKEGYLQSLPADPGCRGSEGERFTYISVESGNGVACLHHGMIQPKTPETPAREQLMQAGMKDPALLARAAGVSPYEMGWDYRPHRTPLQSISAAPAFSFGAIFVLSLFLNVLATPPRRRPDVGAP